MEYIRGKIRLSGDYEGHRDADIQFRFRFCDDGIYHYLTRLRLRPTRCMSSVPPSRPPHPRDGSGRQGRTANSFSPMIQAANAAVDPEGSESYRSRK